MFKRLAKPCCEIDDKNEPSNGQSNSEYIPESRPTYRTVLKDTFIQYLETTSLHGLKFIGDPNISAAERFFFIIAFALSVMVSSYYISAVYTKWHLTPILITTSSTSTSIASIPFPAITICNLNQAKRSLVSHIKPGMTDYANLQTLCKNDQQVDGVNLNNTGDWEEFRNFILRVSQPCDELLLSCRYGSVNKDCTTIFQPILTDEGLCCTFNNVHADFMFTEISRDNLVFSEKPNDSLKPVKWTPEDGFQDGLPTEYYPRKAQGTGVNMGLTLVLNASVSDYFCSTTRGVGFKMLLHNPTEIPKITNYGYLLSVGVETQAMIQPNLHNAATSIRRIDPQIRHCVFADEVQLRFYRTYTKSNCELECESIRMLEKCGCVTYYLPRTSKNTEVCGLDDFECIRKVQHELDSLLNEASSKCHNCIPGCVALSYLPVMTSADLVWEDFELKENYTKDQIRLDELAVVHFFYEQNSFRARTKDEFLGFADFLANSGGILGLFLGFSMLSLIEMIYFLAMVPQTILKNYIHKKRSGNKERTTSKIPMMVPYSGSYWIDSASEFKPSKGVRHVGGDFQESNGYFRKPETLKSTRNKKHVSKIRVTTKLPYCD